MESFSAYARHFLGTMERPDVDKISGLSPVISIEQKTTGRNPRSTVGTITEVYDFLRLLYARAGDAYSYVSGEPMVKMTEGQIVKLIVKDFKNKRIILLAPVVKGRKGHYKELFKQILQKGFLRVRVDGEIKDIAKGIKLDRYKVHDIEIVIDKLNLEKGASKRLNDSINMTLKHGKGSMLVMDEESKKLKHYSQHLMCPTSGISYDDPAPNKFSFNSPYGASNKCNGLGTIPEIDIKSVVPDDKKSIKQGGIAPLGKYKDNWIFNQLKAIGVKYDFTINTPIKELSNKALNIILYGSDEVFTVDKEYSKGDKHSYSLSFEGIATFIQQQVDEDSTKNLKRWAKGFMQPVLCDECNGSRLNKEALYFKILDKNIFELAEMDIAQLHEWFLKNEKKLSGKQLKIGKEIIKEIKKRLHFLLNVGLDYLTINRSSKSLSGGESQRIRLATQIGSQLVGVLYILDEPSIGLHQRDNIRLINSLKELRDLGNSIIVVEHDKETILSADHVIDIGPGAGVHGGKIIAEGTPKKILKIDSITSKYLSNKLVIETEKIRKGNGKTLSVTGAKGNNLKDVNVTFPLGTLICVTGVSGSGKSTLINDTVYPILNEHFYHSKKKALPYKSIKGLKNIDKVIEINQAPIGRTPRSNPATYTGVFSDIRALFASLPEAQIRGYAPGSFSFNVKGGRCETCRGAGMRVIEMNFLPDVHVECEECNGKRYHREILEVRYRGKSINDVLNLSIEQAVEFFENIPSILHKIKTLEDVGLGYITLGQQSTTLSGGEAQRVKLASELAKKDTGNTFYILDEPTTGLHFEDVRILLDVLHKLVDKGNTVVVIEHNMDVIKCADHIIDLGPDGGHRGGMIITEGSPEEIVKNKKSITAQYLKKEIKESKQNPVVV
ncbi:MAG: excinuclease ABC subunit UvrA, partial [Bacteroidia bacterium]|nr:excinuclease ABC subunit UvrA [Bacteroidia bacterium]